MLASLCAPGTRAAVLGPARPQQRDAGRRGVPIAAPPPHPVPLTGYRTELGKSSLPNLIESAARGIKEFRMYVCILGNNSKMPGRSGSNSGSTRYISFSGVESALSSLKNFQACISSGMDTVSSVALDLVETQTEVSSDYSMDRAMVEFAKMERELSHYVKAVQSTISHCDSPERRVFRNSLNRAS
ncbi:E3 SUMO-protein ligase NSE2 isoform 2 [Cricetulus griseus]|nr:E3 SUMO-protein ligase NSE2 isoform 2 [Cricetulus griseus]